MSKLNERGVGHILVLLAAVGLIAFILIAGTADFKDNMFASLYSKPASHASTDQAPEDQRTANFTLTAQPDLIEVGETATVAVKVDSPAEQANLFRATLTFSKDRLEATSIDTTGAGITKFYDKVIDNNQGTVTITGSVDAPGIKTTSPVLLANVAFKAKALAEDKTQTDITVSATESKVYRNSDSLSILKSTVSKTTLVINHGETAVVNNCSACSADVNYGGSVDIVDFSILRSCIGKTINDLGADGKPCWPADTNGDGVITGSQDNSTAATNDDFGCVKAQFGNACAAHNSTSCTTAGANIDNSNTLVDIVDFSKLRSCYNQNPNDPTCARSDIDKDGVINYNDFQCLRTKFGSSTVANATAAPTTPPAPCSVTITLGTPNSVVKQNSIVPVVVHPTGDCNGKQLDLVAWYSNGIFGGVHNGMHYARTQITPSGTITLGTTDTNASWVADFEDTVPFGWANPPKYKVIGTLQGTNESFVSNEIRVEKLIGPLDGDGNRNGQLDLADLSVLIAHVGKNSNTSLADLFPREIDMPNNGVKDGIINTFDYSALVNILVAQRIIQGAQ